MPGDASEARAVPCAYSGEEAPRARHRTCADVAPAQVDTLVIKRLGPGLREADLLWHLAERGPAPAAALSADLLRGPDGNFTGTAFVRFVSPEAAHAALECLGSRPRLGGRRTHVEPQKSKALLGGRELETCLPKDDLKAVRDEVLGFLHGTSQESALPPTFSAQQRKYAHSLAEQHGLCHSSQQAPEGVTYVLLAKASPVSKGERRGSRSRWQFARTVPADVEHHLSTGISGEADAGDIISACLHESGLAEMPAMEPSMVPVLLGLPGLRPPPGLAWSGAPQIPTVGPLVVSSQGDATGDIDGAGPLLQ